ncbi:E2 [Gammapapillomavirus 24]|uniref:Regulatory protein E2 n=2 Tax=Papillomaviridae TaxID=151340 RepID=A0A385PKY5_9PAPI|nr:E2 [Gammapapillomavirus 24]AYA94595.1 MAG: E2 protein [Human papillomavirus]
MEWLTDRFNAVQETLLNLIEQGAQDLDSQIEYWNNVRKENVYMYYAKREGLTHIGLQPLPVPAVSEYKAKQAIHLVLLLQSLKKSPYATESWTLQNTSEELINTQPKDCFKKHPYTVEVWFDNDRNNSYPYINWDAIYYQDSQEKWHKVPGLVDYNGLYYNEVGGDRVYFTIFDTDAQKYGQTGMWTVHFKRKTLVAPISSSKQSSAYSGKTPTSVSSSSKDTLPTKESPRRLQRPEVGSSTGETTAVRRRRREQGESSTDGEPTTTSKRRRGGGGGGGTGRLGVSPEEVGSRHHSATGRHRTRLEQLKEEARDPPIIIVTGPANSLKCWRYRKQNSNAFPFLAVSTIFTWVGGCGSAEQARMLIAFNTNEERTQFIKYVQFPKQTTFALGQLDKL